jgi:hypothetical protein
MTMGVANIEYQEGPVVTMTAAAAVSPYRLVKIGASGVEHCGASDVPYGVTGAVGAAAGDVVAVTPLSQVGVCRVTVAESLSAGADLSPAADGKVQDGASSELRVLRAMSAAGADGDVVKAVWYPVYATA